MKTLMTLQAEEVLTIQKFNKLAKLYNLRLYRGKGYYYWETLNTRLTVPESVYVYSFKQGGLHFWLSELGNAVKQSVA